MIGFETAEIDILLDGATEQETVDPADATLEDASGGSSVTRPGDLWILGEHRILCADALRPESYARLMGEERARLVFTEAGETVRLSSVQLSMLIEGIDWRAPERRWRPTVAG